MGVEICPDVVSLNDPQAFAHLATKIQHHCQNRRLRIQEFFLDYDKLRSGFLTKSQFYRVLDENLQLQFSDEEKARLEKNFSNPKKGGDMNWRAFANTLEQNFDSANIRTDPVLQRPHEPEYFGTERTVRPLSPNSEDRMRPLLARMIRFYTYHGLDMRTAYLDFDPHNLGRINQTQFYRNFPGPPDVTEDELNLLLRRYSDPNHPEQVVYMNLFHDLSAIAAEQKAEKSTLRDKSDISKVLPHEHACGDAMQDVMSKIEIAAHKFGIRTTEFFRDYDKLRKGCIPESQFRSGLALGLGKEAQLSAEDINTISSNYRLPDGKIDYFSFCERIENSFTTSGLDKRVGETPPDFPSGVLGRTLAQLSDEDEGALTYLLRRLRAEVARKRILLYPYFKDYDRAKAYTRVMSANQLHRVLATIGLECSTEDIRIIAAKFKDPTSGDVNYPAFVQALDPLFTHAAVDEATPPAACNRPSFDKNKVDIPEHGGGVRRSAVPNIDDVLARIRGIVLANSLRVAEFFADFDRLRHDRITAGQFRRCLDNLGLSKLRYHDMSEEEFGVLCAHYSDRSLDNHVNWTKFVDDVESVFTQPNLTSAPMHPVPTQETFRVPPSGTMNWHFASEPHNQAYEAALTRLRSRVQEKRIDARPVLEDFDKHRCGHITRTNFQQVLTMLDMPATPAETDAIEARWVDDRGFNYRGFLEDLAPVEKTRYRYPDRIMTIRAANANRGNMPEVHVATDLEGVLYRIKNKVVKDRIRVVEFLRDYDKLRSGRIKRINFRRGVDLCGLGLSEGEYAILENHFSAPGADGEEVEWQRFGEEIESAFTQSGVERAPLAVPQPFEPSRDWQLNVVCPEDEGIFSETINRVAVKVRKQGMQLWPLFEDYDTVHSGHVSKNQFRRVLTELTLSELVSEREFGVLCQKFDTRFGGRDDVNYSIFCDIVYHTAGINPRVP